MSADTPQTPKQNKAGNRRLMLLVFFALIAYTFSELWSFYAQNRHRVSENTGLVELLHSPETALIRSGKRRATNPSGQPLATVATISAGQQEIEFARFEPVSERQIKIWFEDIRYDQLVQWVSHLELAEGVSAISLNIERGNAQGMVSGQVELAREPN